MCIFVDHKVLLIGPGVGSHARALNLPDLTTLDCKIPAFPGGKYYGYVGRSLSDGVLMCGGFTVSSVTSSCYLLTSSGYQELPGLSYERGFAASVVTPLGLWVTGKPGVIFYLLFHLCFRRIDWSLWP